MAKVQPASKCVVKGIVRNVDGSPGFGSITIVPSKSGIFNGVIYTDKAIQIRLQENGSFSIALPPSSVCGTYTFIIQGKRMQVSIPDGVQEIILG